MGRSMNGLDGKDRELVLGRRTYEIFEAWGARGRKRAVGGVRTVLLLERRSRRFFGLGLSVVDCSPTWSVWLACRVRFTHRCKPTAFRSVRSLYLASASLLVAFACPCDVPASRREDLVCVDIYSALLKG